MEKPRAVKAAAAAIGMILLAAIALGMIGSSASIRPGVPPPPSRFAMLVAEARSYVPTILVHDLRMALASERPPRLIDVREESEWAKGRIPGAVHIGKGVIERDIERAVPDVGETIVLYCGSGSRSILAAENLQRMGYRMVFSLEGGYQAWLRGGNGPGVPTNVVGK